MRRDAQRQTKIKGILKKRSMFKIPSSKYNNDDDLEPQISSNMIQINKVDQDESLAAISPDSSKHNQQINHWVHGGLRIMFYITKFIRQMKNNSTLLKFKLLSKNMVELIGDAASDTEVFLQRQTKWSLIWDNLKWMFDTIPVVEPDSKFKILWDCVVLVLIVINIFFIPMKLGFNLQKEGLWMSLFLDQLPSWMFVADIVLSFNTAYYSKGQIHRDKRDIVKEYARLYLWWDLLIVIPYILSTFDVPYTEYILLLRVFRVKSMIDGLEEVLNPKENIQAVFQVVKSIFFVIFITHFCACLWNLIGEFEVNNGYYSWLSQQEIETSDWNTKYIHALYFSTITTLTVGYGDVIPQTDTERVFVILMALVVCGVLGYTISSIGSILKQLSEKDEQFKQKMMFINRYLKKKQLNMQLQLQVRKYFEYFFMMESESNEDGEQIMQNLNKNLKELVAIDIYERILLHSRIIKSNFSQHSIKRLCQYVHEKKYAPEEIIVNQKDQADKLYFILSGEVNITCKLFVNYKGDQSLRETKLATIHGQKCLGEREFIVQGAYDYTIKAQRFTQMAYIYYDDFIKVLKEDDIEEEKFYMLRDNLLYNEEQRNFGQICMICQWTHSFKKCPYVFLIININKLRQQFKKNDIQSRSYMQRTSGKKQRSVALAQQNAVALIVNHNIKTINDMTDSYLGLLGLKLKESIHKVPYNSSTSGNMKKSNVTSKSLKSILNRGITQLIEIPSPKNSLFQNVDDHFMSDSFSDMEEDVKNSNIQTMKSKISSSGSANRKVKFNHEPEAKILRTQRSFHQRVENKHNTISRLSLVPNSRFNFVKSNEKIFNNQLTKTQSLTTKNDNYFDMLNMLEHDMAEQNIEDITHQRVELDIDRFFIGTNYNVKDNIDTILANFKKPPKTLKRISILDIMKKRAL